MSVKDSESRRFESKIGPSFSQADVGPTSAPDLFFSGFSKSLELFILNVPIGSVFYFFLEDIFENSKFLLILCFPMGIGLEM